MSEELSPLRVRCRRAAARTLRRVLDALVAQGEKGIAAMGPAVERAFLLARLAEIDATADGSVRATLDRVTIELGAATTALVADVADGREDEHHKHAAALERIAGIALRGAGAARRRAEEP